MPPGCFALKGETTIAAGNSYTLSVSFADSSPNGGVFPETCRFPAGGILCRPYSGIVRPFWLFENLTVGQAIMPPGCFAFWGETTIAEGN